MRVRDRITVSERPTGEVAPPLIDAHGRTIRYLRISVTDRCDMRCRYCMAETMTFLPRDQLATLDELAIIAERFIARGVRKVRLSGGEPLVRRNVLDLVTRLGSNIGRGLDELTMTTNGTRLDQYAPLLAAAGIRRVNVSLDSRDADRFRFITRTGDLERVLAGITAARAAGLTVKINMVALKGLNEHEIEPMLEWCVAEGHDLTLIETMPLGMVEEDRTDCFLPLTDVLARLDARFELERDTVGTGGPARYWRVGASRTRIGFISPLTANFCESCNRVRLTTEGKLYTCLGHEDSRDLKRALREGGVDRLDAAISDALSTKPRRHDFKIEAGAAPAIGRHMSVTGG